MIQIKDNVTHPVHGVGTVINTYNNGSICAVDFKGVTKRIETANLQKGANIYTGKSQAEQYKEVLVEVQKLHEYFKEELKPISKTDFAEGYAHGMKIGADLTNALLIGEQTKNK